MKKILVLSLAVALGGCGFDDLDAAKEGGGGIGNSGSDTQPPNIPEVQTRWTYSSSEIDEVIFAVTANNEALNSFNDPVLNNTRYTPRVTLQRQLDANNVAINTVAIFVGAKTACLPSCDVRIRFNGQLKIYRMQNSTDGVIIPADRVVETALFKKFATANSAVVSLPIIGLPAPFDANFDLRGYDEYRMSF